MESPQETAKDRICPTRVGDVLPYLANDPLYPKLCSALNKFAELVEMTGQARAMTLDLVHQRKPAFRPFLQRRGYNDATICHYVQWVFLVLDRARALGWVPDGSMSAAWREIITSDRASRCQEIARYFAAQTASPNDVTRAAINDWVDRRVIAGERTFMAAHTMAMTMTRALLEAGYTQVDPMRAVRMDYYGVPLAQFPSPLKEQMEELIAARLSASPEDVEMNLDDDLEDLDMDDFRERSESEENRPPHQQIREITAKLLIESTCRLFGYVHNVKGKRDINTIQQLFNPRVLVSQQRWLIRERRLTSEGLRSHFVPIISAMRQSKIFDPKLLQWLTAFRAGLGPKPSRDEVRFRKANKQLEYSAVAAIPAKIYRERFRLSNKKIDRSSIRGQQVYGTILNQLGRLSMYELAIRWILILPWRQRNLREMRVDGAKPNLFKGRIPSGYEIDKPDWVVEEERCNPAAEFWMYRFSSEENKTGKLIFCVLPQPLIKPLEDYLNNWRPILLKHCSSETLFVNSFGRPMERTTFGYMICEIALRYGGKRMNPHIFRDVFAFAWLKRHPQDYLQLSLQLWHSSIKTTIENYSGKFNASCTTAPVERFAKEKGLC